MQINNQDIELALMLYKEKIRRKNNEEEIDLCNTHNKIIKDLGFGKIEVFYGE